MVYESVGQAGRLSLAKSRRISGGVRIYSELVVGSCPDDRDYTANFKNIMVFDGRTIDLKGLQISVCKPFLWACFGFVATRDETLNNGINKIGFDRPSPFTIYVMVL